MKKVYKTAIFDVDGTVLDTTEGILAAVTYTIDWFGMEVLSKEQMLKFIGPPIQNSFRTFYHIEDNAKLQELATVFRDRYKDYELLKAKPYNGIFQLCEALVDKGVQICFATYKRQDYAEKILHSFCFDQYGSIICGADHENKLTKEDIIRNCLRGLETRDGREAVMIGDSIHDANGAQKVGLDFLGVTYGFDFKSKNDIMKYVNAVGYAEKPKDLQKYF